MSQPEQSNSAIVEIARCPEHGLHGCRTRCYECGEEVEQVRMVPVGSEVYVVIYQLGGSEAVHDVYATEDAAEAHIRRQRERADAAGVNRVGRYTVEEKTLR